jgi:hypothetical protein
MRRIFEDSAVPETSARRSQNSGRWQNSLRFCNTDHTDAPGSGSDPFDRAPGSDPYCPGSDPSASGLIGVCGKDYIPRLQMAVAGPRVPAIVLCALANACSTSAPTPVGYAGQWTGTTAQGRPIAFTVSADEKVTSITVGYSFNGCSGSQTFSNLNLDTAPNVTCIPGPCGPGMSSYRAFNYSTLRGAR